MTEDAKLPADWFDDQPMAPENRYRFLTTTELKTRPDARWCVEDILPDQGIAAIWGASTSGKSWLAIDLAAHIAEGRSWFGLNVERRDVVFLALEGQGGIKTRAIGWESHNHRPFPDAATWFLGDIDLGDAQGVTELCAAIPKQTVTIIDTLACAAPGVDENSFRDMSAIMSAVKRIQATSGGLVILVAHTGKSADKGLRGHSSVFAALDAGIEVTNDDGYREWRVAKCKAGDSAGKSWAFDLAPVELGTNQFGNPVKSAAVIPATKAEKLERFPSNSAAPIVLQAFHDISENTNSGLVANLDRWQDAAERAGFSKSADPENRRRAFRRNIKVLCDKGLVQQCPDHPGWMQLAAGRNSDTVGPDRTDGQP